MVDEKPKADIDSLREMLRRIEKKGSRDLPGRPPPVKLEDAVGGGRVTESGRGPFYLVEEQAEAYLSDEDEFATVTQLFFQRSQVNQAHLESVAPALLPLAQIDSDRILFLDIETAGFHGMGLFLIGLLLYEAGKFRLVQLFARDYAEEAAVLDYLRRFYEEAEVVVTFNGKAFDLPFISDRCKIHRVQLVRPPLDIDLLHAARRIWKDYLPNCRLVTLEQLICGRHRTGDLPSHLVPKAYHEFVETGDARLMGDVIRHNAYDLVTMAHLLAKIANG